MCLGRGKHANSSTCVCYFYRSFRDRVVLSDGSQAFPQLYQRTHSSRQPPRIRGPPARKTATYFQLWWMRRFRSSSIISVKSRPRNSA